MSGWVRHGRIEINIEGKRRPYTDGSWVVFTPSAFPCGFMHVDRKHLSKTAGGRHAADREKAFTDFWAMGGEKTPLQAAMEGYRIELVGPESARKLLDIHAGDVPTPPEPAGEEEAA